MPKYYTKEDLQFLTGPELESFFTQIESKRNLAMFKLMYFHALRVSEVCRLTLSNISFEHDTIQIKASKKGNSGVEFLNPDEKALILGYLQDRKESNILFLSKKGGHLGRDQVFLLFQKYSKAAKIPLSKRHPHALRHTLAVNAARGGFTAEQAQICLRHKNIANTMKYYRILPDQKLAIQRDLFRALG